MKSFGKKPAVILAAGSFALAMTSCQHSSTQNNAGAPNAASSSSQLWTQLLENISKTIRRGFGNSALPDRSSNRKEEGEEKAENESAGG